MDVSNYANNAAASGGKAATAREVEVLLSANTTAYQQEMKKASEFTGQLADSLERVDAAYKKVLKGIGKGLMGLGASMQASATAAAWSAASFEESFARVAKTTGLKNTLGGLENLPAVGSGVTQFAAAMGIGSNALQEFNNDIRQLSTEIPVGVDELAHLADVAGTLGVESQHLVLYADTAAKLGAAINDLGSAQAVHGLASLMAAFGDAPETVVNLGSSLADLANNTRGSADAMLYFSERLAGTAVQAGMTSEEVLGIGAAVSAIGMNPQLGASAIGEFLNKVNKAVQTGSGELDKFAKAMGLTRDQLKALWNESGGTAVLAKFLNELSSQGQAAAVTLERVGMSGQGAGQVLGGLAAQVDTLNNALGISAEAYEKGSAVAELAAVRFDTVVKALQRLRQSFAEVWRSLGQGFLPMMKFVINSVTNIVNLFNKLPQPLKTAMGLFLGLGGVAVTLAGAYFMVFGTFHAFFIVLGLVKMAAGAASGALLKLSAALAQMGAANAAAHAGKLAAMLSWLGTVVGGIPGLFKSFAMLLGGAVVKAIRAVGTAALWTSRKLLVLVAKMTLHDMKMMNSVLVTMATKLGILGKTAQGVTLMMSPMMLLLGKFLLIAAAIGAAIAAIRWAMGRFGNQSKETEGYVRDLATALGVTIPALDDFKNKALEAAGAETAFSEKAQGMVKALKNIKKNMGDAAAQDYIANFAMELLAGGMAPSEVEKRYYELHRLAGVPIKFGYTFEELTGTGGAGGGGFESVLDSVRNGLAGVIGAHEGKVKAQWGVKVGDDFKANFESYLDQVQRTTKDNLAARLAAVRDIQSDLDTYLSEDKITDEVWTYASKRLAESGLDPNAKGDRGWFGSAMAQAEAFVVSHQSGANARSNLSAQGYNSFAQSIAQGLEDPVQRQQKDWKLVADAVKDVTGETKFLGDVVRRMTGDDLNKLADKLAETAVAFKKSAEESFIGDPDISGLERELRKGDLLGLSEEDLKRYRQNVFETYKHTVGVTQALAEAEATLQSTAAATGEWSEQTDEVRKYVKDLSKELTEIQVKDMERALKTSGATQGVHLLTKAIRDLRAEGSSFNAPAIERFLEMLQDTAMQAQNDFRQLMGEYDRLIEQREELQRSHGERMQRMVEDRNKSLANAQENYQKRIEDIAKQEKQALKDRVEAVAQTYSMMEKIQAGPSRSGAAIISNVQAQTRALEVARNTVNELKKMGLSDEVIKAMGLDDPKNVTQAERFLKDALANPALIQQINDAWKGQLSVSESFVEDIDTSEITERFDEARADAKEALDESIASIHENYTENVKQANEAHAKQIQSISESLAKLGVDSAKTIDELIDRALASGLEGLKARALEVQAAMEAASEEINRTTQSLMYKSLRAREYEAGNQAKDTGKNVATSLKDGFKTVWDNAVAPTMKTLAAAAGVEVDLKLSKGVTNWLDTVMDFSQQDEQWGAIETAGVTGANRYVDGIVQALEAGVGRIKAAADEMGGAMLDAIPSGGGGGSGGTASAGGKASSHKGHSAYQKGSTAGAAAAEYVRGHGSADAALRAQENDESFTVNEMLAKLGSRYPGIRITSRYRSSSNTHHGNKNNPAADLGFNPPGDARKTGNEEVGYDIFNYITRNFAGKGLREVIFGTKLWKPGNPNGTWGKNDHWDHVHFANTGGLMPGHGNQDTLPAMLTPGEFVIRKDAVKDYGVEMMEAINARKFATGGRVGTSMNSRGREPLGMSQGDLVKAFTKAMEQNGTRESSVTHIGPVEVKTPSVQDFMNQMDTRRRMSRLAGPRREDG